MEPLRLTAFRPSRTELALTALAIWSLCLVTFRLPGRVGPEQLDSLDYLALAKLIVRVGVVAVFLYTWRSAPDQHAKREVLTAYAPLLAFVAWAFLSVLWSPLKTVSLGQALGLAALTALSAWIALACRGVAQSRFVLLNLWMAVTAFSFLLVAVHLTRPDVSGLDRELELAGANGLVRPTIAGSTAGLGFVLTLLVPKAIPGFRLGVGALIGLLSHAALLYLAQSRTAIAMTGVVSLLVIWWFYSAKSHAKILLFSSVLICLYLVADPGFALQADQLKAGAEYVRRGQSSEEISAVSGRLEMWQAVWRQVELSPWIGHGYFVTSHNGRLDVWDGPANHTAHNLVLQVLVSTGIVGSLLFMIAAFRFLNRVWLLRFGPRLAKGAYWLIAMIGLWYLGWCQTSISFLGPVQPESVVFFVVLGVAAGQAVAMDSLRPFSSKTTTA